MVDLREGGAGDGDAPLFGSGGSKGVRGVGAGELEDGLEGGGDPGRVLEVSGGGAFGEEGAEVVRDDFALEVALEGEESVGDEEGVV